MKKIIILYLCVSPLATFCGNKSPDATDLKARQANLQNDYRVNTFTIDGKPIYVTSYFNLESDTSALAEVFAKHQQATYDLRPLETRMCKMAMSTMPWRKLHRGKIGLIAGIVMGMSIGVFASEAYKTKYIKNAVTDN